MFNGYIHYFCVHFQVRKVLTYSEPFQLRSWSWRNGTAALETIISKFLR